VVFDGKGQFTDSCHCASHQHGPWFCRASLSCTQHSIVHWHLKHQ
jgi:hypothetical protein